MYKDSFFIHKEYIVLVLEKPFGERCIGK